MPVILVESALGRYSSGLLAAWSLPFHFDAVEASSLLPDHPNVWTDGCLVLDKVTGVSSIMLMGALFMSMTELGSGDFPGLCADPRLQVCTPF